MKENINATASTNTPLFKGVESARLTRSCSTQCMQFKTLHSFLLQRRFLALSTGSVSLALFHSCNVKMVFVRKLKNTSLQCLKNTHAFLRYRYPLCGRLVTNVKVSLESSAFVRAFNFHAFKISAIQVPHNAISA